MSRTFKVSQVGVVGGLVAGVVLALGAWSVVSAAQPGANKPLSLRDANGVYLGNVVFMKPQNTDDRFVTYIPSIDGVFEWGEVDGVTLRGVSEPLLFATSDCSGTAYVQPFLIANQTIVRVENAPFRISPTRQLVLINSSEQAGGGCVGISPGEVLVSALLPVTLPFDINNISAPLRVSGN